MKSNFNLKLLIVVMFLACFPASLTAQWQGASGPGVYYSNGVRNYYVNKNIPGQSSKNTEASYILLHRAYGLGSGLLEDHHVMGKISAVRGAAASRNRKWTVEVNTSSAYNQNMGSIIAYNEPAVLVLLTFNGMRYMAAEIVKDNMMNGISFTGYAKNESLQIVQGSEVADVEVFRQVDPVSINGSFYVDKQGVGVGMADPMYRIDAAGTLRSTAAKDRQYYVNLEISGQSLKGTGISYVLLHKTYTTGSTPIEEHHVLGKISAVRGSDDSWNRKWTVEVNTSSAYKSNRGSIISYNEAVRLVTLTYSGAQYLAAEISKESMLDRISFTGYAKNAYFRIVHDKNVSEVNLFADKDPISFNSGDLYLHRHGKVGIGVADPQYKLDVDGTIRAREVIIETTGADFVFADDYNLRSLQEVEQFITTHRHLPDIAPAESMQKNGVGLSELQTRLLQKVEELTLYVIEQEKKIEMQKRENEVQRKLLMELNEKINQLEK